MARDSSGERLLGRLLFMSLLDGTRPSGIPEWLSPFATAAQTETSAAQRRLQNALNVLGPTNQMIFGVRSGLRHPRRLTVGAIAGEAPYAVFCALRVPRAVRRRTPRIAAGSALVVAGAVARLRAASAEPLR
jgi:hypothetical protein